MLSRQRLAAACLAASLLATPFAAFGKTHNESLLQQAIDFVTQLLPAPTHAAPATQVVESAFSPDGGAEALVLKAIGAARTSIRVAAYSFTSPPITRALLAAKRRGVNVAVVVDDKGNRAKSSQQALNLLVNAGIPTRTIDVYAIHHDNRKPGGCYMALRGPVPEFASVDGAVARRHPKGRHEHEDVCHAVRGVEVHDFTTVTVLLVKCVDIDAFHIRHGNKT